MNIREFHVFTFERSERRNDIVRTLVWNEPCDDKEVPARGEPEPLEHIRRGIRRH